MNVKTIEVFDRGFAGTGEWVSTGDNEAIASTVA